MSTTLIVSIIFAAIVLVGSIYHSKRMKGETNWFMITVYTVIAFVLVWVIYLATEYLGELGK